MTRLYLHWKSIHEDRGATSGATFVSGMFGVLILFIWAVLFISLQYFTQGLVQGNLTSQGLAQMVSLLPAPQNVSAAKTTLNSAVGTLVAGASPRIRCSVTRYAYSPATQSTPNGTVSLTTTCQVATLAFGQPTLAFTQDISVFYAHVVS
jgi:hypothetical protein